MLRHVHCARVQDQLCLLLRARAHKQRANICLYMVRHPLSSASTCLRAHAAARSPRAASARTCFCRLSRRRGAAACAQNRCLRAAHLLYIPGGYTPSPRAGMAARRAYRCRAHNRRRPFSLRSFFSALGDKPTRTALASLQHATSYIALHSTSVRTRLTLLFAHLSFIYSLHGITSHHYHPHTHCTPPASPPPATHHPFLLASTHLLCIPCVLIPHVYHLSVTWPSWGRQGWGGKPSLGGAGDKRQDRHRLAVPHLPPSPLGSCLSLGTSPSLPIPTWEWKWGRDVRFW